MFTHRLLTGMLVLLFVAVVSSGLLIWHVVGVWQSERGTVQKLPTLDQEITAPKDGSLSISLLSQDFERRRPRDTSGYFINDLVEPWPLTATSVEIGLKWKDHGRRSIESGDKLLANGNESDDVIMNLMLKKASYWNFDGNPTEAYKVLEQARAKATSSQSLAEKYYYTLAYFQGVCALRRGENDNCIMCRGESSCILPISSAARHTNEDGSRVAIKHFTEYLDRFPDDIEVQWLLNLAHMTLGEHPDKVDPRFLISLDRWQTSEFDIGRFRDIGHLTGINRLNQAGGAILDDFDNDGLLDFIVTSFDPQRAMAVFHNNGAGAFNDMTKEAGVMNQQGGLNCVQADFNNDGWMDVFITRGAWLSVPMRPTLLRNNGQGRFQDVTEEAGLLDPINSNSASWADYDNDGWLDLFVCCEKQLNRLYRNRQDGTFESVAEKAGVQGTAKAFCKGASWIDYDNDDFPDLFINNLSTEGAKLFHNQRDGTFAESGPSLGIDGPQFGFSTWAWDYNNDGWLDIFATSYDRTLQDIVLGLQGKPHTRASNRLFRNRQGQGFEDVTAASGLDLVFGTMGSNFADFDNDGFLDMYLGTGDPEIAMLIPNRMFKNVDGKRFAEITTSTRTGNLQKGHGVACGDWDRDGDVDLFIEMGGAIPGDQYHNILFQNPGQGNHWLSVKLVGTATNRAAIGARIKAVSAGDQPRTVHRHVSSGSSFGANPLQQHLGLGQADRVALLEIYWPTSRTTQTFRDLAVDQAIEITELTEEYKKLDGKPIRVPQ